MHTLILSLFRSEPFGVTGFYIPVITTLKWAFFILKGVKMKDLIVITKQQIGSEEINSVDARELHVFLEVGQHYSDWIKKRIKEYNFTQHTDFITNHNSMFSPPRKDYTITIDMAKELSMVEKNQKGKEARKYFIECEKELKLNTLSNHTNPANLLENELKIYSLFKVPEHIAQIESVKQVQIKSGVDLSYALLVAPAQQKIKKEEVMLAPSELGKHFGLSGMKMNQKLKSLGLQTHDGDVWVPTKRGRGLSFRNSWTSGTRSGYNLKWNLSAIKMLKSKRRRK